MDLKAFTPRMPGLLVKTIDELSAFAPNALPPSLELSNEIIGLVCQAEATLGQLMGIGQMIPNPYLLINPFLRREAILSSKMEGTIATPEQLVIFEAGAIPSNPGQNHTATDETREVHNYIKAMNHGLMLLKDMPFCLRLVREVHRVLMTGVRGDQARPGDFRTRQNGIGTGNTINEARFIPPPVKEMNEALEKLELYMDKNVDFPILIQMALIHYQFETIHPFEDGNGRVGRLMIPMLLCAKNKLKQPLLYISAYFEKNKSEYIERMFQVSTHGAWAEWIKFFLLGIIEQADDAISRSRKLLELQQEYREKIQSARGSVLNQKLVDALFKVPVLTLDSALEILKVAPTTIYSRIKDLVEDGILTEMSGKKRDRIWLAQGIIRNI